MSTRGHTLLFAWMLVIQLGTRVLMLAQQALFPSELSPQPLDGLFKSEMQACNHKACARVHACVCVCTYAHTCILKKSSPKNPSIFPLLVFVLLSRSTPPVRQSQVLEATTDTPFPATQSSHCTDSIRSCYLPPSMFLGLQSHKLTEFIIILVLLSIMVGPTCLHCVQPPHSVTPFMGCHMPGV